MRLIPVCLAALFSTALVFSPVRADAPAVYYWVPACTLGTALAGGTGTTATVSLTVTEAANQTLHVGVSFDDQGATARVVTVTFPRASTPTALTTAVESAISGPKSWAGYLTNPDSGTPLDITVSAAPAFANRAWRLAAIICNDADQTTPISGATLFENAATAAVANTTVSTTADLVLAFGVVDGRTVGAVTPNPAPTTDLGEINGDGALYLGTSLTTGAASVNTGWSWTGNSIAVGLAYTVTAVGGGGGGGGTPCLLALLGVGCDD